MSKTGEVVDNVDLEDTERRKRKADKVEDGTRVLDVSGYVFDACSEETNTDELIESAVGLEIAQGHHDREEHADRHERSRKRMDPKHA